MKSSTMTLLVLLIALPISNARADSYDPAWRTIRPKRTLRVVVEAGASDTQNGDRLRKTIEGLRPGDQLVIGTGTYSVDRFRPSPYSPPIWPRYRSAPSFSVSAGNSING